MIDQEISHHEDCLRTRRRFFRSMGTPSVLLGGNFCTQIPLRTQNERLQPWIKGLEFIPIPRVHHPLMLGVWITHHKFPSSDFK